MLVLEKVSKKFCRENDIFFAIQNFSLELGSGEFVAMVGHSGSGKSTVANIIAGFLKPDSGSVVFEGKNIENFNDDEISQYRSVQLGYLPQSIGLLPNLTIEQNIALPTVLNQAMGKNAQELAEYFKIIHLLKRYPKTLSAGERKRALLCRALINNPKLLLLDEPTSDLDQKNAEIVMNYLYALKNITILCITHDVEFLKPETRVIDMENPNL